MFTTNIIILLLICILSVIIIYYYYNNSTTNFINRNILTNKQKKQVRFNKNVQFNTYDKQSSDNNQLSNDSTHVYNDDTHNYKENIVNLHTDDLQEIDLNDDYNTINVNNYCTKSNISNNHFCGNNAAQANIYNSANNTIHSQPINENDSEIDLTNCDILASNYPLTENNWDSNFGVPLMTGAEKTNYYKKLFAKHKNTNKAMCDFGKFQTDNSVIIKTDTTIDMFNQKHTLNTNKGQSVSDVYDNQIANVQVVPKVVKYTNDDETVYENESHLNGGDLQGSNMKAFDCRENLYKTSGFGNEF